MKKTFNLQKTIISLLFSGLILLPLISCKFNTKQQITENEDIASDTVSDTVSVGFNIALPDEYKINPSRSAIPEFSDDTLRYDVIAAYTENGTTKQITREGFDSVPFYLPLIPEKTYTITVKAYARTDASKSTLFTGSVQNITVSSIITEENGPFSVPLMIYKDENGNITSGNGSLNLRFIVDYASSQGYVYKYRLSGNGITPITNGNGTGGLSRNTPFNINITDIPANSNPYDFVVTFKAGTNIVYQFYTDVMIFAGAETNTWKNEQELGSGENSNTVVITQALVNAYTSKYFYIKNDSTIEAGGQGTYEAPWRSLQSAFDKINEINDGTSTYRVYILGDLTGSYVLNTNGVESTHYPGKVEFELPSSNTKDLHLLIQGIGSTKPTLNSAATAPEISITNASNKTVTVELKNIDCAHEIEVENVDITLTNINTNQTSSTALIEVSGGDAVLTNVKAGDITVTNSNATLNGVNSNAISITIPASNTNGTATLQDVQATTSIEVSGGNATLTNVNTELTTCTATIEVTGGNANLTNVKSGSITIDGDAVIGSATTGTVSVTGNISVDGDATLTGVTVTGNITIGGTANGTSELTNVNAGNITVSNGNATLNNVHAAAIQITNGNATMTSITATGNVTVGGTATIGSATTGTVTITGDITAQSATLTGVSVTGDISVTQNTTLTNVTVTGDITVSNGNAVFKGVNENATSTSTTITVSGGDSTLENIKSAVLTVSGGAARLYNVTCPSIDFTDVDITLIGVTSTPAPATDNNITLDGNCTIKLGGTTAHPNTIGKIYLPNNTSDAQIKFEILNQDTDGSALTLNGSHIGFSLETQPDATTSFIQFTDGLAQASNTSDLPNTIFTNLDDYNIGVITPSGQTGYEAGITISSGNINTSFADNITFQIDKSEIERNAHNATDTGSFTIPSTYTANPRTITVTAKNGDDDLPASSFTTLSLRLVTSTNTVLASSSNATITVPYGQTEGNYTLRVFGLYNDGANTVGYSSDFIITVVDNVEFMPTKTILVKDGTDAEKTLTVSGTYNSNNLTIGCLDSTTTPFTITEGSSATVTLSADSPACGQYSVNLYGFDVDGTYFRDTLTFDVIQFVFNCTATTTSRNISVKVKVSNNSSDDIILTPTSDFNIDIKKVTGSGSSEVETEIYIYDDLSTDSTTSSLIYTVPEDISVGLHRIYITAEYNGITKTEIVNTNLSGLTQTPSGTFNSSTSLSDSGVFIANRNITIPQLIASDHEVTQGEYEQFMTYYGRAVSGSGTGASGNSTPYAPSNNYGLGSDYPAYYVCWYEAIMYCNFKSIADNLTPAYYLADSSGNEIGGTGNGRNPSSWLNTNVSGTNIAQDATGKYYYNNTNVTEKLDYQGSTDTDGGIRYDQNADGWRLPTEAEWEYFARGGNLSSTGQQTYIGTDSADELTDYAWYGANSGTNGGSFNNGGKSHEVKTKLPNALNLYDMCGNVWEWCWDWEGSINADTDITGASSGNSKSTRGGGWSQPEPVYFTISHRHKSPPRDRYENLGFRVVRTVFE